MVQSIEEQQCLRCNRPYRAEARDRGLCCICERDFRLFTRYGPNWRIAVRRSTEGNSAE